MVKGSHGCHGKRITWEKGRVRCHGKREHLILTAKWNVLLSRQKGIVDCHGKRKQNDDIFACNSKSYIYIIQLTFSVLGCLGVELHHC